jgi:hypothetical protein
MKTTLVSLLLLACGCAAPTTEMVACPAKGCAALDPPTPIELALFEHAEFDLQCPRDNLDIKKVDPDTLWVCGCGRGARYAYIAGRHHSRWVLDSPVLFADPPPSASRLGRRNPAAELALEELGDGDADVIARVAGDHLHAER